MIIKSFLQVLCFQSSSEMSSGNIKIVFDGRNIKWPVYDKTLNITCTQRRPRSACANSAGRSEHLLAARRNFLVQGYMYRIEWGLGDDWWNVQLICVFHIHLRVCVWRWEAGSGRNAEKMWVAFTVQMLLMFSTAKISIYLYIRSKILIQRISKILMRCQLSTSLVLKKKYGLWYLQIIKNFTPFSRHTNNNKWPPSLVKATVSRWCCCTLRCSNGTECPFLNRVEKLSDIEYTREHCHVQVAYRLEGVRLKHLNRLNHFWIRTWSSGYCCFFHCFKIHKNILGI